MISETQRFGRRTSGGIGMPGSFSIPTGVVFTSPSALLNGDCDVLAWRGAAGTEMRRHLGGKIARAPRLNIEDGELADA